MGTSAVGGAGLPDDFFMTITGPRGLHRYSAHRDPRCQGERSPSANWLLSGAVTRPTRLKLYGQASGAEPLDWDWVARYERKYDSSYEVDKYGPLTRVAPETVLAWRTAGWAGRESFQQTGRWRFG